MQKTSFRQFLESVQLFIKPALKDSWSKRSIIILSLLLGYYFTNSLISYLLDKSVNTIFLALIIVLIMEVSIRTLFVSNFSKISILIITINNFRLGSTYALILEAFKLGS